jgi:hypothetical protein
LVIEHLIFVFSILINLQEIKMTTFIKQKLLFFLSLTVLFSSCQKATDTNDLSPLSYSNANQTSFDEILSEVFDENMNTIYFGPKDYERETGKPIKVCDNFSSEKAQAAKLLILNGPNGLLCSSLRIEFNDIEILNPEEYNKDITELLLDIELKTENNLCITVNGKPNSSVQIVVYVENRIPTEGLIAYYPFNGNAIDESNNGNDGTVSGAVLTTDRFGNLSKAYDFDGINDRIFIASSNYPTGNVTISYSAWMYREESYNYTGDFIIDVGDPGAKNRRSSFSITTKQNWPYYCVQDNDISFNEYQIQNQKWYHLVLVKNGIEVTLYIDGEHIATKSIQEGQNITNTRYAIGSNADGSWRGGEWFHGKLDDIRIYNRPLSEQEVITLYNE